MNSTGVVAVKEGPAPAHCQGGVEVSVQVSDLYEVQACGLGAAQGVEQVGVSDGIGNGGRELALETASRICDVGNFSSRTCRQLETVLIR